MSVSIDEYQILRHSLGLNYKKKPFRNHFCTDSKTVDFPHCENLVKNGLMRRRPDPFNTGREQFIYYVTKDGENIASQPFEPPTKEV